MKIIGNVCFNLNSEGFFKSGYVIDRTSDIVDHIGTINAAMMAEMEAGIHSMGITIESGVVAEYRNEYDEYETCLLLAHSLNGNNCLIELDGVRGWCSVNLVDELED